MPKTTYEMPEEPEERPRANWGKIIAYVNKGFGSQDDGKLSRERYRIKLGD